MSIPLNPEAGKKVLRKDDPSLWRLKICNNLSCCLSKVILRSQENSLSVTCENKATYKDKQVKKRGREKKLGERQTDRMTDKDKQRAGLTLNEPLVPTRNETNFDLGLSGTSTNKFPFMIKLGKDEILSPSFERSLMKTDLQDDYPHLPKENCSFIIMKPLQR